ncbi:MAG: hypothetical protein AAF699_12845 [Pseudomonadota bacterium]
MSMFNRLLMIVLFLLFLGIFAVSSTHAHLIEAQSGTLNIVDEGAFMVLPLPISSFHGLDQNSDGRVTLREFTAQRREIMERIRSQVSLRDAAGLCELQGIMLSPVASHDSMQDKLDQIIVMGRFALQAPDGPLHLIADIFGGAKGMQQMKIKVSRRKDSQSDWIVLTTQNASATLFAKRE